MMRAQPSIRCQYAGFRFIRPRPSLAFFLAPITTRNTAGTDAVSRRAASTLGAGRSGKFGGTATTEAQPKIYLVQYLSA
jgi:hypothetical protein